jgi:hypothetical protein
MGGERSGWEKYSENDNFELILIRQYNFMEYTLLSQDERDEILANTLKGQEMDHFLFSCDKSRYEKLIETLPEGEHKENVKRELLVVKSRIEETNHHLDATKAQISELGISETNIADAMTRITDKQELSSK